MLIPLRNIQLFIVTSIVQGASQARIDKIGCSTSGILWVLGDSQVVKGKVGEKGSLIIADMAPMAHAFAPEEGETSLFFFSQFDFA